MNIQSRRVFLKSSGALALFATGLGGVPTFIARAAALQKLTGTHKKTKVLVCIFQRGAMDGLMAVSPFTDSYLQKARPSLFLSPAKTSGIRSLIDLDGQFGLHPAMASFASLFAQKKLAIVHGVGSPNNTRSHFDAQDLMETGTPFNKNTQSGWLNRASGLLAQNAANSALVTPFQAVSITNSLPRSLYGERPALAIANLKDFSLQMKNNPMAGQMVAQGFEDLYDQTTSSILNKTGKESFEAMKILKEVGSLNYTPENGAVYPNSALANSLKQIAQLIKMNVGLEIAFAESGGWDTHNNQGAAVGAFSNTIGNFTESIAAFWKDIALYENEVDIMTMTEFGRTVKQNGTGGTDHGRASCMFVLGNNVAGGLVHGNIPTLAVENLEDGRDVPVTTDFRSVFSEVVNKHLALNNDALLFGDWKAKKTGVMLD